MKSRKKTRNRLNTHIFLMGGRGLTPIQIRCVIKVLLWKYNKKQTLGRHLVNICLTSIGGVGMLPECCLNVAWMLPECCLNVASMLPPPRGPFYQTLFATPLENSALLKERPRISWLCCWLFGCASKLCAAFFLGGGLWAQAPILKTVLFCSAAAK